MSLSQPSKEKILEILQMYMPVPINMAILSTSTKDTFQPRPNIQWMTLANKCAEALMETGLRWIKTERVAPPIFPQTKTTFLGAWITDGETDSIDHLSFDGINYWSQESANKKCRPPDFWMPIPKLKENR